MTKRKRHPDTERLDWLEKWNPLGADVYPCGNLIAPDGRKWRIRKFLGAEWSNERYTNLRDAIDAARRRER